MDTFNAKCKVCGEVKIDGHFEGNDGELIVPVFFAKTEKDLRKYVEDVLGESYEKYTGNKFEGAFEKRMAPLNHENPEEVGWEEFEKHSIGSIECWCEII
jgi:hypothetical protein